MDDGDARVRIAAIVCLTVIVVAAIAALTVVAVLTDRDLWKAEALTFAVVLILAALSGYSVWGNRRRYHFKLDTNGDDDAR